MEPGLRSQSCYYGSFIKDIKNFKVLLSGSSKTLNSMLYRLSVNRVLKILKNSPTGDSGKQVRRRKVYQEDI